MSGWLNTEKPAMESADIPCAVSAESVVSANNLPKLTTANCANNTNYTICNPQNLDLERKAGDREDRKETDNPSFGKTVPETVISQKFSGNSSKTELLLTVLLDMPLPDKTESNHL